MPTQNNLPELFAAAGRAAYERALAAGLSVVLCDAGAIYEVFPDGTRKFVKTIAPPTPVKIGTKVMIR